MNSAVVRGLAKFKVKRNAWTRLLHIISIKAILLRIADDYWHYCIHITFCIYKFSHYNTHFVCQSPNKQI